MSILRKKRLIMAAIAQIILFSGLVIYFYGDTAHAERKFARKECLDCHKKFADKYMSLKSIHGIVKQGKCEECHMRHGIVPKLMLKGAGNDLCFKCHDKAKIGLTQPHVHTALKSGKCTTCHNPHASKGDKLMQAEGNEVCYLCHKKERYEGKAVVHKVLSQGGCRACHASHSAP